VTIIELRPGHVDALSRFFAELPAGGLTFIEEYITDDGVADSSRSARKITDIIDIVRW
jgi:hypothetical protein